MRAAGMATELEGVLGMADNLTPQQIQEAVQKGFENFLEKKYAELGKWTLRTIVVATLGALFIFWLKYKQ